MRPRIAFAFAILSAVSCAQMSSGAPHLIRFSGQVPTLEHASQSSNITFMVYAEQTSSEALWTETQAAPINDGRFTVLLGSTRPDGLPISIFAAGEARWISWEVPGQPPSPRIQLVSVPYALSAASAETFAGHSISEFLLSTSSSKLEAARMQRESEFTGGTPNMLAKYSTGSATTASQVYDNGSAVGVGTVAPAAKLDVAGDIKISGSGNGLIFPDGTRFSVDASGINTRAIEQVRYADQFAAGSRTGGIAEAYADCPSSGCKVQLGQDVNIASPQTITVMIGKPLVLDLAGRTITVTNPSGIGLTFTSENINARTPMTLSNGTLTCSWTQAALVGFSWKTMVNVSIENVDVRNCNTPGSTAILWDFVEDAHMNAVGFRFNTGAFRAQNASNQIGLHNVWFDGNANPVILANDSGVTLEDCLVQSNTGTRAVQFLTSSGQNATTLRVHKCHFENNGDGSIDSRNIYVAPSASQVIIGVSIEDNIFTAGAYGAQGVSFEVAGSQTVSPITFKNNQYNGYSRGRISIGINDGSRVTAVAENLAPGDSSYDVGINTHGMTGLSFAPAGARRAFQLFAGWPGNYDGFLQFWDTTANTSILSYSAAASSWTFSRTAVFDAPVILNNSSSVYGFSDHQQTVTWTINSTDGSARFNGSVDVGSGGLTIGDAPRLTTTAQTGSGSIVMSNGATLRDPDLGNARASSLTLNGEQVSASPRMVYSTSVNFGAAGLQSRWTLDKPIVVTRFQFVINNGVNSRCSLSPALRVTDGVSQVTLVLTDDQRVFDSGPVTTTFSGDADLDVNFVNGAGCNSYAVSGNAVVQYRMQ